MAAVPIAPTRPSATKKTRPNIADEIPASRTALACVLNALSSRRSSPNNFTNMAPATLNRSVIWVFIVALCCI